MKEINHGKTTKVLMLEGETLFHQGDKGDKAYMIIHGILDVLVDGKKVGSMRDGEVFGEMALILKQNRSATIISSQSSELITISKENLDELISSGSKAAQEVIINLCKELAKRTDFQNVPYSHEELDDILDQENQIIKKITKQILYRLERSTSHIE